MTDRVRSSVRKGPFGGEPGLQAGLDRPAVDVPAEPRPGRGRDRGPGRLRGGPGTSSQFHPLQRPKFRELLTYARPGYTVHISEMFRLVRGNQHILDVLDVLHRDRLSLRIHDGAFSAMDLTSRHRRTGELLSTVKFMVQTLAAAAELQRELQHELTYDGPRAAEADTTQPSRPTRPATCAPRRRTTPSPDRRGPVSSTPSPA
ncbi:recombinase family protein [Streptomyces sp. SKN60]|uniref:recombinase family protein n=1 Tax=Streptomyces sp. SKN60 TaxID=2855506 RepID=UPI0022451094|nr:recombinase family protein [Streptomyces sp. SKN60]